MGLKARDQQEGMEMEIVKESKGEYQREKEKKKRWISLQQFCFFKWLTNKLNGLLM